VDRVLHEVFPEETQLSSRLSLDKCSELGLLRAKCEVYAQDPVCQVGLCSMRLSATPRLAMTCHPSACNDVSPLDCHPSAYNDVSPLGLQ